MFYFFQKTLGLTKENRLLYQEVSNTDAEAVVQVDDSEVDIGFNIENLDQVFQSKYDEISSVTSRIQGLENLVRDTAIEAFGSKFDADGRQRLTKELQYFDEKMEGYMKNQLKQVDYQRLDINASIKLGNFIMNELKNEFKNEEDGLYQFVQQKRAERQANAETWVGRRKNQIANYQAGLEADRDEEGYYTEKAKQEEQSVVAAADTEELEQVPPQPRKKSNRLEQMEALDMTKD